MFKFLYISVAKFRLSADYSLSLYFQCSSNFTKQVILLLMELHRQLNLLDQALGLDDQGESWPLRGKVVLIEDCVETSGAFVLHHLVKQALSQKLSSSNGIVIFISLSQSFSHYARILQKLVLTLGISLYSIY